MDIFRLNVCSSQRIYNSAFKRPRAAKISPHILLREQLFPFLEEGYWYPAGMKSILNAGACWYFHRIRKYMKLDMQSCRSLSITQRTENKRKSDVKFTCGDDEIDF